MGMLTFGWISDKLGRKFGMVSVLLESRQHSSSSSDDCCWYRCSFCRPVRCFIGCKWQLWRNDCHALCMPVINLVHIQFINLHPLSLAFSSVSASVQNTLVAPCQLRSKQKKRVSQKTLSIDGWHLQPVCILPNFMPAPSTRPMF